MHVVRDRIRVLDNFFSLSLADDLALLLHEESADLAAHRAAFERLLGSAIGLSELHVYVSFDWRKRC